MASVSSVISRSAQRFRLVNSKVGRDEGEGGYIWEDVCACMEIADAEEDLDPSLVKCQICRRACFPRLLIPGKYFISRATLPSGLF